MPQVLRGGIFFWLTLYMYMASDGNGMLLVARPVSTFYNAECRHCFSRRRLWTHCNNALNIHSRFKYITRRSYCVLWTRNGQCWNSTPISNYRLVASVVRLHSVVGVPRLKSASLTGSQPDMIYVAAKATYIRLLHGKIGILEGFFGPSSVHRGRTHIVFGRNM